MTFAESLQRYSDNIAIITESGQEISYAALDESVDRFAESVASSSTISKQLIFLSAGNNLASIIAYIYCLKNHHAVMLLNPDLFNVENQGWLDQLIQGYRPNALIKTDSPEPTYLSLSTVVLALNDDLALLLSTSGSTGSPKQVRLSYKNMQSNADAITNFLGLTHSERAITTLPLHYSYGLSVLNTHLSVGASIVLNAHSIVTRDFWRLFKEQGITSFAGVPFMYETLRKVRFEGMDLPSLRYMTQAGGKLSQDNVKHFSGLMAEQEKLFVVMYGQTEATARMSYLSGKELAAHPDSIGVAIPGGSLTIEGEKGELVYRGDNVMMGYAECLADLQRESELNKLETGDLAYQDDQGLFYLIGRQSRTIKLFGLRIDMDELETRLAEQGWPVICLSAGQFSDGKQLAVAVLKEDENDSANEPDCKPIEAYLTDVIKLHHSAYDVQLIDTVPRTANGKISYLELEKHFN